MVYGIAAATAVFTVYRMALLSLFFQQEEYDGGRFLALALRRLRLVDKKLAAVLAIITVTSLLLPAYGVVYAVLYALSFVGFAMIDRRRVAAAKKALALTVRLRRIWFVAFVLAGISGVVFYRLIGAWGLIAYVECLPLFLVLGNLVLTPVEKYIQSRIIAEAKEKLQRLNPVVIGITGSYGKTSVKHILAHILSFVTPTLHTPGSVNTMMGISRIIREKLSAEHKYFLVEMGAYGIGSIERLCEFTAPKHGILCAVGDSHYERFKTIENVARAKFELGTYAAHGVFAVNGYRVRSDFIERYAPAGTLVLGRDLTVTDKRTTTDGIEFTFLYQGNSYVVKAPLFGLHHVENIALAIMFCLKLGIDADVILESVKTLPQITHRLEVIKNGEITYIDDAYNSNPAGFRAALEVLAVFKNAGRRTILVTPGMVELGELHDKAHAEIGMLARECADVILAVGPERIKAFVDAAEKAVPFPDLKTAKQWITENGRAGDVILFENDLPDLYENKTTL